jgi:hypothetical protein
MKRLLVLIALMSAGMLGWSWEVLAQGRARLRGGVWR